MTCENIIANKVKESGMTIKTISDRTGVPYSKLQPSLRGRREFRADEYVRLCAFFGIEPMQPVKNEQSA
jgi:predicted transcriptional regulator